MQLEPVFRKWVYECR